MVGIVIGNDDIDVAVAVHIRGSHCRWLYTGPCAFRHEAESAPPVTEKDGEALRLAGDRDVRIASRLKSATAIAVARNRADPENRKMIRADDNLKLIFDGNERLSMFEMTSFVSKHLLK